MALSLTLPQEALETIQAENSHLFQFCKDVGLTYDLTYTVTAGEIWLHLKQWYTDDGTLTYTESSSGKPKANWLDRVHRDDTNVKGANQVVARFQNLFPKVKRVTVTSGADKNRIALLGIGFKLPDGVSLVSQQVSQVEADLD